MKRALLMILLVLSIPFYSAFALAEVRSVVGHGEDVVSGYRRVTNDRTIVVADAKLVGKKVGVGHMALEVGGQSLPFDSCDPVENGYSHCTFESAVNSLSGRARSVDYSVVLRDGASEVDRERAEITYDDRAPTIDVSVRQTGSSLLVDYTARDTACADRTCRNRCSGIGEIHFGNVVESIDSTSCTVSGSKEIPVTQDGLFVLPVTVIDRLGLSSSISAPPLVVDRLPPTIDPASLTLLHQGRPVGAIGSKGVTTRVELRVFEENLTSITADFSMLNKLSSFKESYGSLPGTCVRSVPGQYRCHWKDVFVLPLTETGVVSVTAVDRVGHTVTQSLPFKLVFDTVAPIVSSIESNGCFDGKCYVKRNDNRINVHLRERESGFFTLVPVGSGYGHNIVMDLKEMSPQYDRVHADNCTQFGDGWTCSLSGLRADGRHLREFNVVLSSGSEDDAGNTALPAERRLTLDVNAPVVVGNISVTSGDTPFLFEGLPLRATATVFDDSHLLGRLSSAVVLGDGVFDVECSGVGTQTCTWEGVGTVAPGPILKAPLRFEFIDMAGNSVVSDVTKTVVAGETEGNTYWKVAGITHSPTRLNKDTLFVEQKVFFTLPMNAPSGVEILDSLLTDCTGDTQYLLEVPRVMFRDGRNVYVEMVVAPFGGSLPDVSEVKVECTMDVVSLVNQQRVSLPQPVPFTLEVPLASSKLGGIGGNVEALLSEAREYQVGGLNSLVGALEPIVAIFEKICSVTRALDAVSRVSGLFTGGLGLGGLFGGNTRGAQAVTGASQQTGFLSGLFGGGAGGLGGGLGGLKQYCKYISCDAGLWDGWYKNFQGKSDGLLKEPEWSQKMHLGATPYPQNTRDSLVLSLATGCLPGVIHNLWKKKQVHCQYVDCLQNAVPQGISVQYCTDQFHYLECRYVYGQIFELIPYSHFMKRMGTYMKTILANPVSLVFGAGALCRSNVGVDLPPAFCQFTGAVAGFGSIKRDFEMIGGMKSLLADDKNARDLCETVGLGKGVK